MPDLTADDVLNTKFQPTRMREGYDQDEVDDFLDTVVARLASHEAGTPGAAAEVAELCRGARFTPTKFREGYDQSEVDALLDRLSGGTGTAARAGAPNAGRLGPAVGTSGATTTAPGTTGTPGAPGTIERRTRLSTPVVVLAAVVAVAVVALLVGTLS